MTRRSIFATSILMFYVCASAAAQTGRPLTDPPRSHIGVLPLWTVSVGNPEIVAGGFTMVMGRHTTTGGRFPGSFWRGIDGGVEAGPGALTARAGWTDVGRFDFPSNGWSADAVYVHPWRLALGVRRQVDHIGPGVTFYGAPFRLSAAVLTSLSSRRSVAPMLKAGVVLGLD